MKKFLAASAVGALAVALLAAPAPAADFDSVPHLVRDANTGSAFSDPRDMVAYGSRVIYRANTASTGSELWISDGSKAGTKLLKNISSGGSSFPTELVSFKGKVYFTADDGIHGRELWVTNGTSSGTKLVRDITLGAAGAELGQLVATDTKLFFAATDPFNGQELWTSDGTSAGTTMISDIGPGTEDADIYHLTRWNSTSVIFRAEGSQGAEPWVSNGSSTVQLADINTTGGSYPADFTVLGSNIYFSATTAAGGRELWTSDGTAPAQVKNIAPGAADSNPIQLMVSNGSLFFVADDGTSGTELWVTTGSTTLTSLVKDIRPGAASSDPQELTSYNGKVYFSASDGPNNTRLWSTDGTPAGTVNVTAGNAVTETNVGRMAVAGGILFFSAHTDAAGDELWQTTGTAATTRMTKDLSTVLNGSQPMPLATVSNTLFFSAVDPSHGKELWAYTTRSSTTKGYPKSSYSRSDGANRRIRVTVKVRASGTTPIGKVVLKQGSTIIGTKTLSGGNASVRITKKLGKGSHRVRAYYYGSVRARTSHSALITIKVR